MELRRRAHEELVVGSEEFISLQRLQVYRTHGSGDARVASRGRVDQYGRSCRVPLRKQKAGCERGSDREATGQGQESPPHPQKLEVFENVEGIVHSFRVIRSRLPLCWCW